MRMKLLIPFLLHMLILGVILGVTCSVKKRNLSQCKTSIKRQIIWCGIEVEMLHTALCFRMFNSLH